MSLKTKIARYAATQKAGLPVQVETIIRQIGSTDFPRSDVSAIFCKPDFTAWHLMTKKRIIYKIIFPEAIGDDVPRRNQMLYLKSSTLTAMLSGMGIDGCACPDCSGMGTRINKTDVDQFIEKCKRCAGIGFIENPSDEIQIRAPVKTPPTPSASPPAEKTKPQETVPPEAAVTIPKTKPGTGGQISDFLQSVKRGFMPASRELIAKKCAGKEVTKDTLIESIIDAFIDAILDSTL